MRPDRMCFRVKTKVYVLIMKILIAGGGIGGLTLAGFLQQRGISFELAEQAPAWSPVGAGIALAFNPMNLLRKLGVADRVESAGCAITGGVISNAAGKPITIADLNDIAKRRGPTIGIHRAALHEVLVSTIDPNAISLERGILSVENRSNGVAVTFANGNTGQYDLVVGADGINSAVRSSLWSRVDRRYSGYTCWRLVVDQASGVDVPWEMWGRGRRFGVVPIGPSLTYCFSTLNAPPKSEAMRTIDIDRFRELFADFGGEVPGILTALQRDDELIHGDLEEVRLDTWVNGRVVLLGDAAHAMTPNMGQGAAMAIEDAYVLASELAADQSVETALSAYQSRRKPRVDAIQRQSWNFGRVGQWESSAARGVRNALLGVVPAAAAAKRLEAMLAAPI